MSVTLYRKYRPRSWREIAGQQTIKDILSYEIASGQIAHAYLFAGPRGVGKTTIARIFAKALNCTDRKKDSGEPCHECSSCRVVADNASLDIIEIDAASHRGIDSVRENIIEAVRFAPTQLAYKIFIIDEVHMLTTEAFNALLKTLEEPPAQVVFILATTELHKVPATILSRCQRFDFKKIGLLEVVARLQSIVEAEKMQVEESVLLEIARQTEGCLRDAEGILGKLLALSEGNVVTQAVAATVLPRSDFESAARLMERLIVGDAAGALKIVGETLDAGADIEQFMGELTELLRKTMLIKLAGYTDVFKNDLDEARLAKIFSWTKSVEIGFLVRALEVMLEKRREIRNSHPVQLPLELAMVIIAGLVGKSTRDNDRSSTEQVVTSVSKKSTPVESSTVVSEAKKISTKIDQTVSTEISLVSIDEIKTAWPECLKKISVISHSLSLWLGTVQPVEVNGKTVRLGASFQFYKDKLNEDKTRAMIEGVLFEVTGQKMLIEGVSLENQPENGYDGLAYVDAAPDKGEVQVTDGAAKIAAAFGGQILN